MRILVNDYAGHPFELQLSRALAARGHAVLHTYFAAYQTPKGRMDEQPGLRIEPVAIGGEFSQFSPWKRRRADREYGRALCGRVREFRPDVVLSANTPLDAQRLLQHETRAQGGRFIFWMQDKLSAAVEFVLRKKGVPFAGLAGRAYARAERRMLRASDAVVCIAPEFLADLERWGIEQRKTFVVENWAPLDEIAVFTRQTGFSRELGLDGKFCFLYSGTLGMKHKPELLLALARSFEGRDDVAVVVVAQGAGAAWLAREARGLHALKILPFQPYERHAEVLGSADALITLLDEDCGAFAVPSKLLAYLCAGRPQLVAAPGINLAGRIVERAGAGLAVQAEEQAFLHAAGRMLTEPERRAEYAANARAYAERTFRIDAIRDRFEQICSFALGEAATARVPPVPQSSLQLNPEGE